MQQTNKTKQAEGTHSAPHLLDFKGPVIFSLEKDFDALNNLLAPFLAADEELIGTFKSGRRLDNGTIPRPSKWAAMFDTVAFTNRRIIAIRWNAPADLTGFVEFSKKDDGHRFFSEKVVYLPYKNITALSWENPEKLSNLRNCLGIHIRDIGPVYFNFYFYEEYPFQQRIQMVLTQFIL